MQRPGEGEDIANIVNTVSFFADERSGFVSGQALYGAGGPRNQRRDLCRDRCRDL
ncbi:MAG TPA: hypothetical protein VJ870_14500 [Amycolatopsis sp.]|nr:hypothetical protein [Amycolatopsis sp.]